MLGIFIEAENVSFFVGERQVRVCGIQDIGHYGRLAGIL